MKKNVILLLSFLLLFLTSVSRADKETKSSSGEIAYKKKLIDWMNNAQIIRALSLTDGQWKRINRLKSNLQKRLITYGAELSIKRIELKEAWTAADLDVDPDMIGLKGSPTAVNRIFSPPKRPGGEMIEGESSQERAKTLVARLKGLQVI